MVGTSATDPAPTFRPDIQGLRAIAVLLVLVYHLAPQLVPGGYVGVDVFFVISGFLITSLLLKDLEVSGRISFSRFYVRRARRLLPASLVTLAVIVLASWWLLPQLQWRDTSEEVTSSALYVENWRLAHESVDYLQADSLPSVTQHFWSLSVEEQFYLGWPLLLFLVALVARTLPQRVGFRRIASAALLTVIGASLAWSIHLGLAGSTTAYFSTFTRIWQLASGGLLAVLAAPPSRWDRAGLIVGLSAIVVAALVLSDSTSYPGYAALLPSGGAFLALQCGRAHAGSLLTSWLALRPVQFIGDLSYSLYLWHWPIIAIREYRTGQPPRLLAAIVMFAMSIALAAVSKRLVEDPFRGPRRRPARVVFATAAGATAACVALAFALHRLAGPGERVIPALSSVDYPGAAALFGARVPDLGGSFAPPLVDIEHDVATTYHEDCVQQILHTEVTTCAYGSRRANHRIALIGDSHAVQWIPAFQSLIEKDDDLQVVLIAKTTCAFSLVPPYNPRIKRTYAECAEWSRNVIHYLADRHFDRVLVALSPNHILSADTSARDSRKRLAVGIRQALDGVARSGHRVAVLGPTPWQKGTPRDCVAVEAAPFTRCATERRKALWRDALTTAALAGGYPVIEVIDLFCPGDRCPPIIGNVFVYRDSHHITASYMRTVAPFLADRLGLTSAKP